jgi:hypothetical protein
VVVVMVVARVVLTVCETVGELTVAAARFAGACIVYGVTRRRHDGRVAPARVVWAPAVAYRCPWCGAVDWSADGVARPPAL